MKEFSKETIKEVENIYGKASKEEIEQAKVLLNNPDVMKTYYEDNED